MPPGADRFETLMRLVPNLSGALVVTIPSQVSYLVVRRAIHSARQAGACLLGLVENMAGLAHEDGEAAQALFLDPGGEGFAAQVGIPHLGKVPFDPRLAHTTDAGRPFVLKHSETTAGRAILALARRIEAVLETGR